MNTDQLDPLLRRLRRKPLHEPVAAREAGAFELPLGRAEIERLVPHRAPMLLVESVEDVDMANRTIRGTLRLSPDDGVFAGHFPGDPVFPGMLLVEAMGQLGLCLIGLGAATSGTVHGDSHPLTVRATRVHHAVFLDTVTPDAPAQITAALLDDCGLTRIAAGQVYQQNRLCAVSILEVYVDDA